MLTGCKASVSQFVTTLTHTCNIGFDGYIARLTTFAAASHGVSGLPCPHYRRRWTTPTNDRCERSRRQTGNSSTGSSSASQLLPARPVSKNSRSFSLLISRLGRFRNFMRERGSVYKLQPAFHRQRGGFLRYTILAHIGEGVFDVYPPCRDKRHHHPPFPYFYDTGSYPRRTSLSGNSATLG